MCDACEKISIITAFLFQYVSKRFESEQHRNKDKMKWCTKLLFTIGVFLVKGAQSQTKEDNENVLYEIFTTRGYNKTPCRG